MFIADDIEVMGRILTIPNASFDIRMLTFNPDIHLCEDDALGLIYFGASEDILRQYYHSPLCHIEAKIILAEALKI